jgi:CheY-like chemotaxis protein/two-component sensor histidine kinase
MIPRKDPSEDAAAAGAESSHEERQRRKLETLGRLSGHVAHDFNNLLMVVDGYARLLLEDATLSGSARDSVEEILRATARGSALTRQLLSFSRKPTGGKEALDLNVHLERMRPLIERLLGESIRLEVSLAERPVVVEVERDQLEQVLLNLIVNSRDAMPLGGRVSVRLGQDERNALLDVEDSGTGIAPELVPRIFEPFFTTKEDGKGTGIGLSLVRDTVQRWSGNIEVESEPGRGTRFRLNLPLAGHPRRNEATGAPILLVEDEPGIRSLIRRALQQHGFAVLEAASEAEALELAARLPELRLLITDLELAGGDGKRLAAEVQRGHPEIKVLFISGYLMDSSSGQSGYLQKPFSPNTLVLAVQRVLGG